LSSLGPVDPAVLYSIESTLPVMADSQPVFVGGSDLSTTPISVGSVCSTPAPAKSLSSSDPLTALCPTTTATNGSIMERTLTDSTQVPPTQGGNATSPMITNSSVAHTTATVVSTPDNPETPSRPDPPKEHRKTSAIIGSSRASELTTDHLTSVLVEAPVQETKPTPGKMEPLFVLDENIQETACSTFGPETTKSSVQGNECKDVPESTCILETTSDQCLSAHASPSKLDSDEETKVQPKLESPKPGWTGEIQPSSPQPIRIKPESDRPEISSESIGAFRSENDAEENVESSDEVIENVSDIRSDQTVITTTLSASKTKFFEQSLDCKAHIVGTSTTEEHKSCNYTEIQNNRREVPSSFRQTTEDLDPGTPQPVSDGVAQKMSASSDSLTNANVLPSSTHLVDSEMEPEDSSSVAEVFQECTTKVEERSVFTEPLVYSEEAAVESVTSISTVDVYSVQITSVVPTHVTRAAEFAPPVLFSRDHLVEESSEVSHVESCSIETFITDPVLPYHCVQSESSVICPPSYPIACPNAPSSPIVDHGSTLEEKIKVESLSPPEGSALCPINAVTQIEDDEFTLWHCPPAPVPNISSVT
uniref:Flocculation protein FLO11-like n=1 Tax=Echinostoma caproni TaxID=27848 RepID=A0A183B3E0_9TREM